MRNRILLPLGVLAVGGLVVLALRDTAIDRSPGASEGGGQTSRMDGASGFYLGGDLSYVNELEDCGVRYRDDGEQVDVFGLFAESGANLVRARLWHDAEWTEYSDLRDVERTFRRVREHDMDTLLDLHYSDTWAFPGIQAIPRAWDGYDDAELAEAVYRYTFDTLMTLDGEGLLPAMVQVGNETDPGMLTQRYDETAEDEVVQSDIDRDRQALFFNAGVGAVGDVSRATQEPIESIIHLSVPEDAEWWYPEAMAAGIDGFDVVGLSYYPEWSSLDIEGLGDLISSVRAATGKEVMVVETGYPWTEQDIDDASNLDDKQLPGYPFTPSGQRRFLVDLARTVRASRGLGVVYWEPAWVSSTCSTLWGQGSHWENRAFFDFDDEATAALDFFES